VDSAADSAPAPAADLVSALDSAPAVVPDLPLVVRLAALVQLELLVIPAACVAACCQDDDVTCVAAPTGLTDTELTDACSATSINGNTLTALCCTSISDTGAGTDCVAPTTQGLQLNHDESTESTDSTPVGTDGLLGTVGALLGAL